MPGSPGTVPRYMLPVMVEARSGSRWGEVHGVEQGGSWCSHRGWLMPYGVMCTAKGMTARCSLWHLMSLKPANARVWERPSLTHTPSARDAAGLRQSMMMPVIVRFWVGSDTLVGGVLMRGIVWLSWRLRALRLASCRCWALWAGVCMPVCLGFLLRRSPVWKGVGQEGGGWRVRCGRSPCVVHVYRVVAAVPSTCMVYRLSCRRWVMRILGTVNSYTYVVWGRWRVTLIFVPLFLRVVVLGMMYWAADLSRGVCSSVSNLIWGWSGFGAGGFSRDFACGATLVSTRYCGLQASGPLPGWLPLPQPGGGRWC